MIEINENFSLKEYNTFGIDVTCKYFVSVIKRANYWNLWDHTS